MFSVALDHSVRESSFTGGMITESIVPANEGIILIDEKDIWEPLPELKYKSSF